MEGIVNGLPVLFFKQEICAVLDLNKVRDRNVEDLSGGELQVKCKEVSK